MDGLADIIQELLEHAGIGELWDGEDGPSEAGRRQLDALARGERSTFHPAQDWILQFADRLWRAEDPRAYLRHCDEALKGWEDGIIPPLP